VKCGELLVKHKYTGAPVVDAGGKLVGMLSEKDCPASSSARSRASTSCGRSRTCSKEQATV
jgi:CBS domain-containing protein